MTQKTRWSQREDVIHKAHWTKFKIKPDYYDAIRRPPKARFDEIKADIIEHGQQDPIQVNTSMIVLNGHTRYDILKALDKEIFFTIKSFDSDLEEKRFVYAINIKRRDLTDFEHIELAYKVQQIDIDLAKQNQKAGGKGFLISEKAKINNTKKIAEITNTGTDTVSKAHNIIKNATEDQKEALRTNKTTINQVYKDIQKQKKRAERHEALKKIQVSLPESVQLHCGPFQEMQVKDNSVNLIFTDPPYGEEAMPLIEDLAKFAARVLIDGGSLVFYPGQAHFDKALEYCKNAGLTYHWIMAVIHSGPSASIFGRKILAAYKPLLWVTKGKYRGEFVKDCIKSEFQGKELHEWAQSTIESDYYIKLMTIDNDVICDPFMGQGTFGVSAVKLKRQFIGAEINKAHFETAQKMISAESQNKS